MSVEDPANQPPVLVAPALATPPYWWSWGLSLRRLPWIPIIILGAFVILAAVPQLFTPFTPDDMTLAARLKPPGFAVDGHVFVLGSDSVGRDVLTRIFYGGRISLIVALSGLLFGGGIGIVVGVAAGYLGGRVDSFLMRVTDVFLSLPILLVALVFVMAIGPSLTTVIAALAVINWSRFARIIRSEVLTLRERGFVLLARVAGCSPLRIMIVHILPNVLNTFVIICSLQLSTCILTEATLSFLGAGIPPPTPTWGNMVSDGRTYITSAWWICAFPGLALTLVVFSFNSLGDWLRDRLDPKLRQL